MTTHPQPETIVFPALPVPSSERSARRLRVCIASPEFIGPTRNGGIGTAYTAMAQALAAAGHQVTCLYLEGEIVASRDIRYWIDAYKREGIELVPLPSIRKPALDAPVHQVNSYETYAWLKQHDHFDIIHFPEWRGPGYFTISAKRQRLAFTDTVICVGTHSTTRWVLAANRECINDLSELEKDFMERRSVELADVVVSPSQYLLNYVAQCGWKLPSASYVQQYILPLSARRPESEPAAALRPITELVFFGRLENRKGVVLFCEALDRLAASGDSTLVKTVTFLGKEATIEGLPAKAYLERRSQKWAWKVQVISDSDQPQAIAYLSKPGRLAVIPSLLENLPNTVLECLGSRIAFVASRVGGIPELIAPSDVERVCFEPRPSALADQLKRALTENFEPASAAIDARANERAWLAWHESLPLPNAQQAVSSSPAPKVSVCLVTYNRPNLLCQALASLEACDYPNLEVVLTDDGSTSPETLALLDRLEPSFTQRGWKIVRQENRYLGAARNTGARHATGEYLLFMDDDNFAEPHEISTLVQAARNTGADIVACGMNYFTGPDAPSLAVQPEGRWLPLGGAPAAGALRNCFGDANALVRRNCFEALGGFTEDYGITHEDWEFHAKAVLKGYSLIVVPEFLFWYRVTPNSMIRTLSKYPNYMRSIRPYLEAVPESVRDLIYFAQGQQLRSTNTLGTRLLDATEIGLTIAWRSKFEAARLLVQRKQPSAAVQLFVDAVQTVGRSQHPLIILEALVAVGQELVSLDRDRAETVLGLAQQMAKATRDEHLHQQVSKLLASLSRRPGSARPTPAPQTSAVDRSLSAPAVLDTPPRHTAQQASSGSPPVSIVIPVSNNLHLTRDCLASLADHSNGDSCELLVVDNASTDGTRKELEAKQRAGRLRLILNDRNQGFARACNQGAQAARGSLLLFLNNDTQVTAGWIEALVAAAQKPGVGVVGARLLYANNTIQHAGIEFINGVPDHPYRFAESSLPEANQFRELDMVTGACLLIRRDLFLQLAGFDEVYRNGVEDVDLCLRARAAGWKVVYEPKAVVYHLEGQSAGRFDHVKENLTLFFERWGKRFDQKMRLRTAGKPEVMPASRSYLLSAASPAGPKRCAVAWEGSYLDWGSLSHVNRELTRELTQLPGISLTRVSSNVPAAAPDSGELRDLAKTLSPKAREDVQVVVRHSWPPDWKKPRSGKLVVIQPWEYGALPSQWVQRSRDVDEFWVPSQYVRRVFVDSGVPDSKVRVVPNGIDPERFRPDATPLTLSTQKSFRFLFVGGTIHRKGADALLRAYLQTFTADDDVCLVIKDFGNQGIYAGQTLETAILAAQTQQGTPEIIHLTAELPPDDLPRLYAACDCLVHPYRGEGFGLPILEAMACGKPVIITSGGAADDFATPDLAYHIPGVRKSIGDSVSGMKLTHQGWLLEPDDVALGEKMRWVNQHREEAALKGQRASESIRTEWTWEKAAQMAGERLLELVGQADRNETNTRSKRATIVLPPCALAGRLDKAREFVTRKSPRQAWEATLTALEVRPFHPEAYLLLAEIAQIAGDSASARLCAERARQMAPGWKPARQFLNRRLKGSAKPAWLSLPGSISNTSCQRLSVCLITKNEESFLGRCLESVRELAHQIVVVDTGSTDKTIEIAKSFGAEVYHFEWCDDFSAARNAALEHATGDWVLALDADEELSPEGKEHLKQHLAQANALAWRLPILDVGREAQGCSYVPRLFRNAPALFYLGRVHEQVFSSIEVRRQEWGLENRLGEARLIHHGYTAELTQSRNKIERNLRLLERAVDELPDEPHLLMHLGLELARSRREPEAMERYRQAFAALSRKPASEIVPELRDTLLSQFCTRLAAIKDFAEIVRVLSAPLARGHGGLNASLSFALALAQMEVGQHDLAVEPLNQCLAKRSQPSLSPINADILSAAPHHCLALCHARLGNIAAAEQAFRAALTETGNLAIVRHDYARFLAEQNRPVDALHRLHEAVTENARDLNAWRLGGQISLSHPQFLEFACDWTGEATRHQPQDKTIMAQRAEALLISQDAAASGRLWAKLYDSSREPTHLAGLVLCELIAEPASQVQVGAQENQAVTRAFLQWYRKCLAAGAKDVIVRVNARAEELAAVLPEAARIVKAVAMEAERATSAESCLA